MKLYSSEHEAVLNTRSLKGSELSDSVVYLMNILKNLKSISIFPDATSDSVDLLLSDDQNNELPRFFRKLSASERFEVLWGSDKLVLLEERQEERKDKHLKIEKALEMLLMPEALWKKEQSSVAGQAMIQVEQNAFDFTTISSPGWLTFEGAYGVEHEVHDFLYLQ